MTTHIGTDGANPTDLVDALAGPNWHSAYQSLVAMGTDALSAIRKGLHHEQWQVRRWSAACVDQTADAETLHALIPLLDDPKSIVRVWAVHSISCEHCRECANPIDVVPLLLRRLQLDTSIRVRRMAAAMLVHLPPDERATPVLETVLGSTEDRKLRLHVGRALARQRSAS